MGDVGRKSFEPHTGFLPWVTAVISCLDQPISGELLPLPHCAPSTDWILVRSTQLDSQDEEKGRRSRWREEAAQEALQEQYFHLIIAHQTRR
jgi:hypothetical protein